MHLDVILGDEGLLGDIELQRCCTVLRQLPIVLHHRLQIQPPHRLDELGTGLGLFTAQGSRQKGPVALGLGDGLQTGGRHMGIAPHHRRVSGATTGFLGLRDVFDQARTVAGKPLHRLSMIEVQRTKRQRSDGNQQQTEHRVPAAQDVRGPQRQPQTAQPPEVQRR